MSDSDMRMPDFPISDGARLSRIARSHGYLRFSEMAEAIKALPYGRPRHAEDMAAVFHERKGTCSTKHRFLAELARECGHVEIQLVVGLYEMSEPNTPGVGGVLAEEGLQAIPEAHCYLKCGQQRLDFTGLQAGAISPFESLIEEHVVTPADLLRAKPACHRQALIEWARGRDMDPDRGSKSCQIQRSPPRPAEGFAEFRPFMEALQKIN